MSTLGDVLVTIDPGVSPMAHGRPAGKGERGVLKVSAVSWGEFDATENKALTPDTDMRDAPTVRRGDLLISRANTRDLVGAVVIARDDHPHLYLSDKVLRLSLNQDRAVPQYVLYALRTPAVRRHFEGSSGGTSGSMQNISQQVIRSAPIRLPPLAEQRRIAHILDQADALRQKRRAAIAQLDTLTQAIFLDMFGDPVTNPKGWPTEALGSLLDAIESGKSPVCLDRPAEQSEWGVLKLGAVTWGRFNQAENKALPPDEAPKMDAEVRNGDILFSRKNTYDLVGACCVVRATRSRLLMPDLIFRLRLKATSGVDATFLQQLLMFPTKRTEVQKLASGSSGSMPNISKGRLEGLPIELPPLDIQSRFARECLQVEDVRMGALTSLAQLDALFASLQHRAFRGEL